MDEKLYGLIAIGSVVELGKGGVKIRNNSGVIEARNAANGAMAVLRVANIGSADNDLVNKGSLSTALTNALATVLTYKGPFDASNSNYNAITDPKKGDLYKINVGGTIDGVVWAVGDSLIVNKTLTGHPATADVDKVDSTEAPDILRTTNVSADGDFAEDPALLALRGTIAGYVADEIAAIPGPTPYMPTRYVALTYASAMSVNIGAVVPDGAKIKSAVVKINTPFNGTAPTLKLGVTGALDAVATEAEIDMAAAGTYDIDCFKKVTGATQAIATRGPEVDNSTAGAADIEIKFSLAPA